MKQKVVPSGSSLEMGAGGASATETASEFLSSSSSASTVTSYDSDGSAGV